MTLTPRMIYLRRMRTSLHFTLPAVWVREYELTPGATAMAFPEASGFKIKFVEPDELNRLNSDEVSIAKEVAA
jgi:hypothetical protein